MRIGALAEAGGVTARTVRFYEAAGLVPPPPRTAGGYRDYPPEAVARLRFIRRARAAGLRLAEIAEVLAIRDGGEAPCGRVAALVDDHLAEVRRRIAALRLAEAELVELARRAAGADPARCSPAEVCEILAAPPPARAEAGRALGALSRS
jgi:MerR family transcriptional regulator, copper efflux regulator